MRNIYKLLSIGVLVLLPIILISHIGWIDPVYVTIIYNQILNTLKIILIVTILTTLLGFCVSWIFAFYNFRFKKILETCLILSMVFPSYVLAFFYSEAFNIFGEWALILTLVTATFPYVFLIVTMSIRSQSEQMIQTGLMFGKNNLWIKFKLILPLIKPAIILSMMLVVGDTFSEFGATYFFGVDTIITGIYEIWFNLYELDYGIKFASWVFVTLIAIYYMVVVFKKNILEFKPQYSNSVGQELLKPSNVNKIWDTLLSCLSTILVILTFVIPVVILGDWTIKAYTETDWNQILSVALNSTLLATLIAVIVLTLSTFILYLFKKQYGLISIWSNGLYSTPGIILAITGIYFINVIGISILPFVFVYVLVLKYLAMGIDSIGVGVQKINRQYYYTAKTYGKDTTWYIFNIQLPLSAKAYIVGGILIWIDVIRELAIGLTIRPQWLDLLSVEIFRYMDVELLYMSGPWILVMVLITLIPIYFINVMLKSDNK